MRVRSRGRWPWGAAALAAALLAAPSCAGHHVPNERRPSQDEAVTSGRGAYSYLELAGKRHQTGELIAADNDRFWILTDEPRLVTVPVASVEHAWFGVYRTNEGALGVWTTLGSLSTISHGAFLIISFPVWLLVGLPSTVAEGNRGVVAYPATKLSVVRRYARFPQGLPPGVGFAQLLGADEPPTH
jgi:hypothetical protein